MPRDDIENMEKAITILRGKYEKPKTLLALAKNLKKENRFGLARKLLNRALQDSEIEKDKKLKLEVAQQQALCTYKDPDLPISDRLDRAIKILDKADHLLETKNQETLGLAGAVFKRKWEVEGHKHYLERSLAYYHRGYDEGPANDYGYTGINAAFVLDRLSNLEEKEAKEGGTDSEAAKERRKDAERIREDLVSALPELIKQNDWLEQEYWFHVTIAEAYFGLQRYEEARPWLQKAANLPETPPWERETTARQLADIVRMRSEERPTKEDIEENPAWDILKKFLGNKTEGVRTAFLGKVGVALSGGGFRASLFHIGVLAKLAEFGMLRHVEVISCVSGGSIVGAHYYLELRKKLQTKIDHEITRDDYIEIVMELCEKFLTGVKRNIRTRVAAEFLTNLKMIAESKEKTLNEIEKALIYHFTELLYQPPKMAKYILENEKPQ